MNRTVLLVFLSFVLQLSYSATTPIKEEVVDKENLNQSRLELRHCFDDVVQTTMNSSYHGHCKSVEDFKEKYESHLKKEKRFNKTYSPNGTFIALLNLSLTHKHFNDFMKNYTCINITMCTYQTIGEPPSPPKTGEGKIIETKNKHNTTNLIYMLLRPLKYNTDTCNNVEEIGKCVDLQSKKCGAGEREFIHDLYNLTLKGCSNLHENITNTKGSASGLTPASYMMAIIIATISLTRNFF